MPTTYILGMVAMVVSLVMIKVSDERTYTRRTRSFLLWVGVGLLAVAMVAMLWIARPGN